MEEGRRVLAGVCIKSVRPGRRKDIFNTKEGVTETTTFRAA